MACIHAVSQAVGRVPIHKTEISESDDCCWQSNATSIPDRGLLLLQLKAGAMLTTNADTARFQHMARKLLGSLGLQAQLLIGQIVQYTKQLEQRGITAPDVQMLLCHERPVGAC